MVKHKVAWHVRHGFKPLINVSGTMTTLGASIASPEVVAATAEAMEHFVVIHQAQARASTAIVQATGAEAGCLTASASAGVTLSVAACMTGLDPARVQALPIDPGPRSEVIVQAGHLCGYGAPIEQAVALTGARVKPVGQSTVCSDYQIEGAIGEKTAAGLYVVSHHVVHYGQCPLARFVELCHAADVPVIVDAASEYDLRGFLQAGADLVIYSAHKFLGGPTAGIIAGQRDLVRAAYLQNIGIGRGMKVGKESILGTIAALEAWGKRDHAAVRAQETQTLELWMETLAGLSGVTARRVPDPTGNPLERLQVEIDSNVLGVEAATVARILSERSPSIIVRDLEAELGYFQLDPCNLKDNQAQEVATALQEVLKNPLNLTSHPEDTHLAARNGTVAAYMRWGATKTE
ncbi:MAG: aminotransferase class V-fold PLP-dependent enzyme [Hyphomicrobiales bacterium]|nr:aminotransferase class V-fold PLP-dependent enzyme [Hyphomicrobiales bacterium]